MARHYSHPNCSKGTTQRLQRKRHKRMYRFRVFGFKSKVRSWPAPALPSMAASIRTRPAIRRGPLNSSCRPEAAVHRFGFRASQLVFSGHRFHPSRCRWPTWCGHHDNAWACARTCARPIARAGGALQLPGEAWWKICNRSVRVVKRALIVRVRCASSSRRPVSGSPSANCASIG
jgi:hypothetical protein